LYSKSYIGVKADGSLALDSAGGGWLGGDSLAFTASGIDFNGPSAASVTAPNPITTTVLPETSFSTSSGWEIDPLGLESIVTRAPTHEPYPYHNTGVDAPVVFEENPTPPPAAAPVPAEVEISRTA
jgi:hypothetical protein